MKKFILMIFPILISLSSSCQQSESRGAIEAADFNETHRPQYHFTPPANWMNDPNGMVFWEGEYHLFYQHYPEGNTWGPMYWGHAVSTDLVHWEHFPIALEPDELGYIFSGSAVIDKENTSGLGSIDNPAMIAIYTYHNPEGEKEGRIDFQTQGLAFSLDKGRSWTKYEHNPILGNPGIKDFRDPKVTWIKEADGSGKWIMSLAVLDKISFYSSPNLLEWTHESDFNPEWAAYGGVWECPDLFPLKDPEGNTKWVLLVSINPGGPQGGSATQYFIGDFDGKSFTSQTSEVRWLDYGADNYAGVTWANVPEDDGRQILIGWMSNWNYANEVPTEVWRSAMTLPRTLELANTPGGTRLASRPIKELSQLRQVTINGTGSEINLNHELAELELVPDADEFNITISNSKGEKIFINKSGQEMIIDRSNSGITNFQKVFENIQVVPLGELKINHLRIFLDRSSLEIFINDGEMVSTNIVFPNEPYTQVLMQGFEQEHQIHYLKSIWN
jgi:fructan beta-fructosidase